MSTSCQSTVANFSLLTRGGSPFAGNIFLNDFNLTLGIGSTSSEIDMQFLDGWCGSNNPPATIPEVGTVIQFSCNNLTFGGIVNSVSRTETSGGFFINIKAKDPRELLDYISLIVKDYYCDIATTCGTGAPNLYNILKDLEPGVAACPPGMDTQNWPRVGACFNFGASSPLLRTPASGVSTLKVLIATNGKTVFTTKGIDLTLNLGEVISMLGAISPFSSIDNTVISVGDLITRATDECGHDFFVELIGMNNIVVRVIDRRAPPANNVIKTIIDTARQSNKLINSEYGETEIYATSNRVIIGDKVKYLAECNCSGSNAHMMMGFYDDGSPVRATAPNFTVNVDTRSLQSLGFPFSRFNITEEEILCSATQQMWVIYGHLRPSSLSGVLLNLLRLGEFSGNIRDLIRCLGILMAAGNGQMPGANGKSIQEATTSLLKVSSQLAKDENLAIYSQAWEWFNSYINDYYGKKWLIPSNSYTCVYPNPNKTYIKAGASYEYLSDFPTDSGYPSISQLANLRGLIPGVDTALFESSDGNITGFFEFSANLTRSRNILGRNVVFQVTSENVEPSSYYIKNNTVYLKSSYGGTIFPRGSSKFDVLVTLDGMIPMIPSLNNRGLLNQGLRAIYALFGPGLYQIMKDRVIGGFDISSINMFALRSVAGGPDFAVVPMQSNVYVYGPWCGGSGATGAIGSTEVEVQTDLNPASCGGWAAMQTVGQSMANRGLRLSNVDESGSFTLAESPSYTINFFTQQKLLVDSVTCNYSSQGVTTKYSFKTYQSKFGDYGRIVSDIAQQAVKVRSEIYGQIRDQRRKAIEQTNATRTILLKIRNQHLFGLDRPAENRSSPGFLLIGSYHDVTKTNNNAVGGTNPFPVAQLDELSCTELSNLNPKRRPSQPDGAISIKRNYDIGLNPKYEIEDSITGNAFLNLGIMSLDGLLSPVSLQGRGNRLSRMCNSWNQSAHMNIETAGVAHKTRPSMPPINNNDPQPINQKYLNPIVSIAILSGWDGRGSSSSFNIQYVGYGTDVSDMEIRELRDANTDFSFCALRGPLVLQAWGYDTEGKPIPNIIDSPHQAEQGIFENAGTKDKFMTNWLANPGAWPVGPIDLRFDRDRGVWVSPPSDRIVVAQLKEDLVPYGSASAVLLNPAANGRKFYEAYSIYGPNGEDYSTDLKNTYITVYDFLKRKLCLGTVIYAAYNDGKYIVLESSVVDETTCECTVTTTTTTTTTETTTTTTAPCDNCGLEACLGYEINGDGVLGFKNGCLTVYPIISCETTESPTTSPP